jgi:hypothetical protein
MAYRVRRANGGGPEWRALDDDLSWAAGAELAVTVYLNSTGEPCSPETEALVQNGVSPEA